MTFGHSDERNNYTLNKRIYICSVHVRILQVPCSMLHTKMFALAAMERVKNFASAITLVLIPRLHHDFQKIFISMLRRFSFEWKNRKERETRKKLRYWGDKIVGENHSRFFQLYIFFCFDLRYKFCVYCYVSYRNRFGPEPKRTFQAIKRDEKNIRKNMNISGSHF